MAGWRKSREKYSSSVMSISPLCLVGVSLDSVCRELADTIGRETPKPALEIKFSASDFVSGAMRCPGMLSELEISGFGALCH